MTDLLSRIPEEDKCCINCEHWYGSTDGGDEFLCHGTMPCLNYHKDNTQNFFAPDEMYLESNFGCEACRHYAHGEPTEECSQCSRYYSNGWERI